MVIKVIEIRDDAVVCTISTKEAEEIAYLDKELFRLVPEIGDILHHIEHGFCDLYRNNTMIVCAITNYLSAIRSYKAILENDTKTAEDIRNRLRPLR